MAVFCTCSRLIWRQENVLQKYFSTTPAPQQLQKLSQVRVVDNSPIGREAMADGSKVKIIHVYNKTGIGKLGDKVLVTIKGQKKRAYIVGCVQKQSPLVPRFDSNNVVLIEDNGMPLGTRIKIPIPSVLRKKDGDFVKILSIAKKFV